MTILSEAVARLGRHRFPLVLSESVQGFFDEITQLTGIEFPTDSAAALDGAVAKLGGVARVVGATTRDTANPTMLQAGYKANVIPSLAEATVDCRVLPGRQEAFERELDELLGPDVEREWIRNLEAVETPFSGELVDVITRAVQDRATPAEHVCIAVDDTAFLSFPGELFTEIGARIKAESPFARTYVIGLANGSIGYVPTRKAIGEGGYAVDVRRLDDDVESLILSQSLALLGQVYQP